MIHVEAGATLSGVIYIITDSLEMEGFILSVVRQNLLDLTHTRSMIVSTVLLTEGRIYEVRIQPDEQKWQ